MKRAITIAGACLLAMSQATSGPALAAKADNPYSIDVFAEQTEDIWLETAAIFAGVTALGFTSWNWSNSDFHFRSEGWFGKDTGSLGMDKLGHAYTSYVIADVLTSRIGRERNGAEATAALIALGAMTYVEIFDGFSSDHGFSYEDMIADGAGIGFAWLRNEVPGLREKLDFRMEYLPSGNVSGFHPITDYSGQKYVLALKLSGFEELQDTPLRFVELQAGYFARGFTDDEEAEGGRPRREPFVGIGLNLSQLLLSDDEVRSHWAGKTARSVLEYVQVPYTYVPTKRK